MELIGVDVPVLVFVKMLEHSLEVFLRVTLEILLFLEAGVNQREPGERALLPQARASFVRGAFPVLAAPGCCFGAWGVGVRLPLPLPRRVVNARRDRHPIG